jgi:hypothetical protein
MIETVLQGVNIVKTLFMRLIVTKVGVIILILGFYTMVMLGSAVFHLVKLHEEVDAFIVLDLDYSALHGRVRVYDVADSMFIPLYGVMVDNHPMSLPQFGLGDASLVIEAPVEGGLTRFVAFFADRKDLAKIGPVRSARPYFIDFVRSFGVAYAHSGGSPEALTLLENRGDIIDVEEIGSGGKYFWRDAERAQPHNLFTSTALLAHAWEESGENDLAENTWLYEQEIDVTPLMEHPHITFSYTLFGDDITYSYDSQKEYYIRSEDGVVHTTALGKKITPKNVVVAFMEIEVVDEEGRLRINTRGTGDALICKRGTCVEGEWEKKNARSRIQFLIDDSPVSLIHGATWMHVVSEGQEVEY